ncbi:MAG: polysaccharide biosynthesis tyrosine autokinase, partial [Prevotella sp.]|nr:polysaccharide biosynthesis tyrosine autokinase [Prevotella sp.]
ITKLPTSFQISAGTLTFTQNSITTADPGSTFKVQILSPKMASYGFAGRLGVSPSAKSNSIAQMVMTDPMPQRAADYLRQLVVCYNRQANEDKNEIAVNTEAFINSRLEKINAELGATEGELQAYKQSHGIVTLGMSGSAGFGGKEEYSKELHEANTQVALINSMNEAMIENTGSYKTLPTNIVNDAGASQMIAKYNELALERNRLLRSASETSPAVAPITAQMDELQNSIQASLDQTRKNYEIRRNSIAQQYNKYAAMAGATPEQERMLTQIGRQQDVKSGLYLMLLQKREENSISLAATVDKGKLIDTPVAGGQISPKRSMIFLTALMAGLAIPFLILVLLTFFRDKIEGHDDVVAITKLPILADVAVASDTAKTKADIVVHENKNNQMEEVFRSMRTNLQFILKENEKVILFTSSTSGEGKTFNAANLAVSFALLGKKVILLGLDIRKPRLSELFELDDHKHGITNLLVHDEPTWEMIQDQILPSGVNNNLDLLMAGPIPPNPTELLARASLENIINQIKEHYDYILIDSAPVGLVTDTLQIGRVADATVYVCRADYTPKEALAQVNSLSAEKKLPKMTIVLNGIDMSKKKYGYYYGYGRYGKYGRYGRYGRYGKYSSYNSYGTYGTYGKSSYGDQNDTSIKK